MPSSLVHVALGAVVATALLGPAFGRRSLLAVLAVTAVPDLDSFTVVLFPGTHRALLHNVFVPAILAALVVADLRRGTDSWLRHRWGATGARTAGVAVVSLALAGVAPDLVTNGANLFYPVHDQFYELSGQLKYSTTEGLVQTFVDLSGGTSTVGDSAAAGTTDSVHYSTVVDARAGADPPDVERVILFVDGGMEALLVVLGVVLPWARLPEQSS
ncbi:MAG: metal-dependent hydrolase [Halobacteriaceae archaeon]